MNFGEERLGSGTEDVVVGEHDEDAEVGDDGGEDDVDPEGVLGVDGEDVDGLGLLGHCLLELVFIRCLGILWKLINLSVITN